MASDPLLMCTQMSPTLGPRAWVGMGSGLMRQRLPQPFLPILRLQSWNHMGQEPLQVSADGNGNWS